LTIEKGQSQENKILRTHSRHSNPAGLVQDDSVLSQQVRLLFLGIPFSVSISAFLGLVLILVQHPLIPLITSLSWYGVLFVVLLVRCILFVNWRRTSEYSESAHKRWRTYFRLSVLVTGFVWGIGGLLMMPIDDTSHQAFVYFTLGGLAAGGMMSLSVDRESVIFFVLPIMSPHIVSLFIQGDAIALGMSAMLMLFTLFMFLAARKAGATLLENAKLRLQAVENESRLLMMLDYSPIAASITNLSDQTVVFANRSYVDLMRINLKNIIGIPPWRFYANKAEYDGAVKHLENGERITDQLVELNFDQNPQKTKWVLASYQQIEYHGQPMVLIWFYDITDRKIMEEQVQHLAYHDPLTDLPNRTLFRDRMRQAITMAERHQRPLAILFIDLDEFKPVNDTYGHDIGDAVLRDSAKRILSCLRKSDSVARFGGDEFVVLLHEVLNEQAALNMAQKIHESLQQPLTIDGHVIKVGASIGVALYPSHSIDEEELLNYADLAMYHAKNCGRNTVKIYEQSMNKGFQGQSIDSA